ncbi:MAG TPA: hypothetical protein VGM60_12280 [Pseudonocardia sp.]|uniref:hypothetical protein n=1 Tax=Pseudonocardia sp. TaxID=60912 RepID=UPI002F3F7074
MVRLEHHRKIQPRSFSAAQFFTGGDASADLFKALAVFAVGFLAVPSAVSFSAGWPTGGPQAGDDAVRGVRRRARLAQGLAHGGELPSAQTYLAEIAPRRSRGLWSNAI